MTKQTKNRGQIQLIKSAAPYLLSALLVLGIAFFGSIHKTVDKTSNLSIQNLASNNYSASADQIAEFYIVSELAKTMNLATAEAVNINYNSLTSLVDAAQTTSDRFEKPVYLDPECYETGVITYIAQEGDTLSALAAERATCGVTETMIRWSNLYKNSTEPAVGTTIYIPASAGFVHKVANDETVASLAEKYKSSTSAIIAANDLERDQTLHAGSHILVPDGDMPETERPDYVAPVTVTPSYNYYYRLYWTSSNPMPWGWCTWYAWARRYQMGGSYALPGGLGNANTWDNSLASQYHMDYTPRAGAVFQTDIGYYGHVGIVESVNADGSVVISDMNGVSGWGRVGTTTISADQARKYKYIHGRK